MDHSSSILKRHTHFEAKRIHIKQTQRTLHSKKGDGKGGGAQNRGIGKRKKVATHSPFSHFLQTHRLHFLFSKFIRFIGYFYGRSSTHWILIILSSQKYVEMRSCNHSLFHFVRKGPSPSFVDGQRASYFHSKSTKFQVLASKYRLKICSKFACFSSKSAQNKRDPLPIALPFPQ